ncbi:hypothetical protein GXY_05046 [Novacetimonas hansenii ATCC 23769]|uniref:Uncharacterized protein n=1 Tax=Novacetimonas hansenii ATCC 23769 TaxID=714995 RepID=D5QD03_NOVHA|nr:hypothetical protein GXY_05046 [Novacetimonas hansenii ATCC 23769]
MQSVRARDNDVQEDGYFYNSLIYNDIFVDFPPFSGDPRRCWGKLARNLGASLDT